MEESSFYCKKIRKPVLLSNKSFSILVYKYLLWSPILWKLSLLGDYCKYRKHTKIYCPNVNRLTEFHSLLWLREGRNYFRFWFLQLCSFLLLLGFVVSGHNRQVSDNSEIYFVYKLHKAQVLKKVLVNWAAVMLSLGREECALKNKPVIYCFPDLLLWNSFNRHPIWHVHSGTIQLSVKAYYLFSFTCL